MKIVGQYCHSACRRTRSLQVTLVYITVNNKIWEEGAGLNGVGFFFEVMLQHQFLTLVSVQRFVFLSFKYIFVFSELQGGIKSLTNTNRSRPQINKALGGLKWMDGHFVASFHTSTIKTKPIKVDVALSCTFTCPFPAEKSRFSWIFCLHLSRSLSPNTQEINHWTPHRLPRSAASA